MKGVTLVATDSVGLLAVHDENGVADESAIVALSVGALRECKRVKGYDRFVVVEGPDAKVIEGAIGADGDFTSFEAVAISSKCKVDGCFPAWRRVVPRGKQAVDNGTPAPHYGGQYVAAMGKAAGDLEKHFGRYSKVPADGRACVSFVGRGGSEPALALFGKVPEAFGVLTPVKSKRPPDAVPEWLDAVSTATKAA